jgi:hypothetical protein
MVNFFELSASLVCDTVAGQGKQTIFGYRFGPEIPDMMPVLSIPPISGLNLKHLLNADVRSKVNITTWRTKGVTKIIREF